MVDQKIDEYCKEVLKGACSEYSGIEVTNYYDRTDIESWSYTLLPVWIITYKYNGKIYPFAINGQTGKLYGSLPADTGRLIAMSSIIAGIAFAFGMLGGIFLYENVLSVAAVSLAVTAVFALSVTPAFAESSKS